MVTIRWKRGGDAEILSLEGESVEVKSTVSSPPGSRFDGEAEIDGHDRFLFRIKVHGCTKREMHFYLQGRVLDLTRERRLALERALGPKTPDSGLPGPEAKDPLAPG